MEEDHNVVRLDPLHMPKQCFGRKEYAAESKHWIDEMGNLAEQLGVKIHGAYESPNEHTFYLILEANDFKAVSEFLGPPMLTHHSRRVAPVPTFNAAFGLSSVTKRT